MDKLERVKARQIAKLEKARGKNKPAEYIAYKEAKVKFTESVIKVAKLAQAMSGAGLYFDEKAGYAFGVCKDHPDAKVNLGKK